MSESGGKSGRLRWFRPWVSDKMSRRNILLRFVGFCLLGTIVLPNIFNYYGFLGSQVPWTAPEIAKEASTRAKITQIGSLEGRAKYIDGPIGVLRDQYEESAKSLTSLLYLQCLVALIGIVVIITVEKSGENKMVKLFDVEVPLALSYPLTALVGLWVWLQFGFVLDQCIKLRSSLTTLIKLKYGSSDALGLLRYSELSALNDSGFLDGWFLCWRGGEHVIDTSARPGAMAIIFLVHGVMLGVAHALVIATPVVAILKYSTSQEQRYLALIGKVVLLVVCVCIVGSHFLFMFAGRNPNLLQTAIALTAFVGVLVTLRAARI